MSKKGKKEKITYIDDGRTIADMSALGGGSKKSSHMYHESSGSRAKDIWTTYWGAVKMMFVPMLVVVCGILIIYMLMSLLFFLL